LDELSVSIRVFQPGPNARRIVLIEAGLIEEAYRSEI
jgi:hypothetical protein